MTIPMIALDSSFEVLTMLRQCMDNTEGNRCSTETHHNFRIFGNSQEHAPRAVTSRTAAKLLLRCLSDSSMQEVNINTGHESDNCDYNMTRVKDILQRLQKYSHEVPATLVILAETLLLTSSPSEFLSATSSGNPKHQKFIPILQSHLIDTITSILSSSLDSFSSNPTSDIPLWTSHRHLLCRMTLAHPSLRDYHGVILAKVIERLVHITSATSGSHFNDGSKIEKVEDELKTIENHLTFLVNLCTQSPSHHNLEQYSNSTTGREVRELIAGLLESWWDSIVIERWKILESPKKEEFEKLWGEWFEKVGALAANDG
ncbi:hypothetical protein BKA69DRAFT_1034862 [Paraphysoderma sedebokerense]|nr:hypothetical protein BKA69DRAFT_1034862 [Paraphysoderma sedebokerense]